VIRATRISRATLNNYIKAGLIPKPQVRKTNGSGIRARRLGYFPQSVLDTITKVRELKAKGYKLDSIINILGQSPAADEGLPLADEEQLTAECSDTAAPQEGIFTRGEQPGEKKSWNDSVTSQEQQRLTLIELCCPTYLINDNGEIEWINSAAKELIFHEDMQRIPTTEGRNVFRFFLKLGIVESELSHYHMGLFRARHERAALRELCAGMSPPEAAALARLYDESRPLHPDSVHDTYVHLPLTGGMDALHHLHTMVFREGMLVVLEPVDELDRGVAELLARRAVIVNEILKEGMPTPTSFCVLIANLQDASRICAELPPEEYFTLLSDLWKCAEEIFHGYAGSFGKYTGESITYYFLKERDERYLMNALFCALSLRERILRLSGQWKMRKHWANELYLNVGVNEGREFLGTIPAAPFLVFTALGDTVNYADRLSDFARGGAIWTTKNLITQLDTADRRLIRYGIRRDELIRENVFCRVMDLLPHADPRKEKFRDIAMLSVTEIFGGGSS